MVFLITSSSSALARHEKGHGCVPRWRIVSSPNPDGHRSTLVAVDAISSRDVWAVGSTGEPEADRPTGQALVEHWDGRKWRAIEAARGGARASELFGVAAVGANDVWAVGQSRTASTTQPLIEHWDGQRWTQIASPMIGREAWLASVAATSSGDVWAVGATWTPQEESQPLIEHWDGRSWTIVPSADLGQDDGSLAGVAAISPAKAWAVGRRHYSPLIEEWDGSHWRAVPDRDWNADTSFSDVTAISPTNVWAVGYVAAAPLVEHYDGNSWVVLRIPSSHWHRWYNRRLDTWFADVAATGPDDLWMTGFRLERWQRGVFKAGPTIGGGSSLAAVSANDIWEVGAVGRRHVGWWKTRIVHYSCT
jgi:hypothetical protein